MTPVLTLPPQPFMQDAGLRAIMETLGAGNALMVGGIVRAAILGEGAGDIDVACVLTPDVVTARLAAAGIKVVPTGIEHGTVTAVVDKRGYEITTLRRDVETDGRRAVVAFTTDWAEDAQRRDFTMNTLLMDMDGHVYDPTGLGVADLKAGIVRFVGDPVTRIAEDALRILRFFRFHARYGKGVVDAAGFKACAANVNLIENLSRERVTNEFERILPLPHAGVSLALMQSIGIMQNFVSSNYNQNVYDVLRVFSVTKITGIIFPLLFAYSVWENDVQKIDTKIERYIVLSNQKKKVLKECVRFVSEHTDSINKNLYIYGAEITLAGMILLNVINKKEIDIKAIEVLHEKVVSTPVPQFLLQAGDVMKATDLSQGKELGDVLRSVESWWLDLDCVPNRDVCIEQAKKITQK